MFICVCLLFTHRFAAGRIDLLSSEGHVIRLVELLKSIVTSNYNLMLDLFFFVLHQYRKLQIIISRLFN